MKCKCGNEFEKAGHRYQCLECRRKYDKVWREKRLAEGLPVRGVVSKKRQTEYNAIYNAKPEVKHQRAKNMRKYRLEDE